MLNRKQAIDLATRYDLLCIFEDSNYETLSPFDEDIITALIEASRGDFHLGPLGQSNKSRVE